jgi:hypothetical protein
VRCSAVHKSRHLIFLTPPSFVIYVASSLHSDKRKSGATGLDDKKHDLDELLVASMGV